MNRNGKTLSLAFILMIVAVICFPAIGVYAQSTRPSPPEFTAQMPNENTIELAIKNQAFTNSSTVNAIVYYYRVKDHYAGQWIKCGNYQLQSDSQTTLITIPPYPGELKRYLFPPNWPNTSNLVDFQVEAVSGYYLVKYLQGQMPGTSLPTNGYSEITFNDSETSEWSSIQTVDISKSAAATSPNPMASGQPTAMITPSPTPTSSVVTVEASTENGVNHKPWIKWKHYKRPDVQRHHNSGSITKHNHHILHFKWAKWSGRFRQFNHPKNRYTKRNITINLHRRPTSRKPRLHPRRRQLLCLVHNTFQHTQRLNCVFPVIVYSRISLVNNSSLIPFNAFYYSHI